MSRADFDRAVADLDARIPDLTDPEVMVGLQRIVAMAGDGHTSITLPFRQLPVGLRWFKDGLFVTAAPAGDTRAIGSRVVRIGEMDINQASDLVNTVISRDNDMGLREISSAYLASHEILYALRIMPESGKARYLLEDAAGARFPLEITPDSPPRINAPDPAVGFVPYWRRDVSRAYWFEYLEAAKTMYVAYNICQDIPGQAFAAFAQQVFSVIDANDVRRLVVDVRNNSGGNSSVVDPLYRGIQQRRSRLTVFAIMGRGTFSSGMWAANTLSLSYAAALIGEPTGGKPNQYGNVGAFNLPNSQLRVQHSTQYFTIRPGDNNPAIFPDIPVDFWSADYFSRHDPFLAAALAFPVSPPAAPSAGSAIAVNAASFRGALAPGSLASVFGDFAGVPSTDAVSLPLPRQIAGHQILVNGVPAPLIAVRPSQINFQVPFTTAGGRAQVRVISSAREIASGAFDVAASAPAIFRPILNDDFRVNDLSSPSRRGSVIQLFATGQGLLDKEILDGSPGPSDPLAQTPGLPQVFIGAEPAPVVFSGMSPQFPGLWQINVRVPEKTTRQMPLFLSLNGAMSNAVTVWIE